MDFGIVTATIDEIGYIAHAENLGYSHCWVTDSPVGAPSYTGMRLLGRTPMKLAPLREYVDIVPTASCPACPAAARRRRCS